MLDWQTNQPKAASIKLVGAEEPTHKGKRDGGVMISTHSKIVSDAEASMSPWSRIWKGEIWNLVCPFLMNLIQAWY